MGSIYPWDEDYDETLLAELYADDTVTKDGHIYYAFIQQPEEVLTQNGEKLDFNIISGTKEELLSLGFSEEGIYYCKDLAFLAGALHYGYFEKTLKSCPLYKYMGFNSL